MESANRLYDCQVTYHLVNGHNINESYRKDIPEEVWKVILENFLAFDDAIELQPSTEYAKALLPKSNISYITMKVLPTN